MRLPLLLLLLCSLFASCATAPTRPAKDDAPPPDRGSIFTRWIPRIKLPELKMPKMPKLPSFPKLWGGDRSEKSPRAKSGRMYLEMAVQPLPLHLSEVRRMVVTIKLINRGKRLVQLQFPSAQRIEVVVLDAKGAKVVQWSEDQLFGSEPSYLTINPGERVQYDLKVATRDLVAGRLYTVEASVPGYDSLRERLSLTTQP